MKQTTSHPVVARSQGVAMPVPDRERLRVLIEQSGETAARAALGVARQTLARCLAGLPVQRATLEYVTRRLADAEGRDAT